MPGIVGLISNKAEPEVFNAMGQSLNHRNYAVDSYIDGGIHLGRVHLNYLNPTKQPLQSEDRNFSLLFYGEIFSIDGKQTDPTADNAAVLLAAIKNNGFKILEKINGQYCAALHERKSNSTYLITDRFGTYPIYYATHNGRFLFASEVKAILKGNVPKKLSDHSIGELFTFGHLFGEKTMFENVELVPAGTLLRQEGATITKNKYWYYPYSEETYAKGSRNARKDAALREELAHIMTTAAIRQSSHADKMLMSLSGGIDSRYVAALYHRIGIKNLPTFTMGSDENEDQRYATMVANVLGLPHYKFNIKPERTWDDASTFSYVSDGMSLISGPLQNFEPLEHFSNQQKIVTYSQMCDALFGSTINRTKVRIHKNNEAPRPVINEALVNLFKRYDDNLIKQLLQPEIHKRVQGLYRVVPEQYCKPEFHPLHNYFLLFMNEYVRRGVLGGNLVINLFYQTRMLSFDNDVFNFGWMLPVPYREHQYLYRMTFGQMFPELAKINRQGYNLKIDASNFAYDLKIFEKKIAAIAMQSPLRHIAKYYEPWNRPGYVDYKLWFRSQLRKKLVSFLCEREITSAPLMNPVVVKRLVQEHIEGKKDHAAILWQIINVEYFYQNFVD